MFSAEDFYLRGYQGWNFPKASYLTTAKKFTTAMEGIVC
jgi:hypothetical protein